MAYKYEYIIKAQCGCGVCHLTKGEQDNDTIPPTTGLGTCAFCSQEKTYQGEMEKVVTDNNVEISREIINP